MSEERKRGDYITECEYARNRHLGLALWRNLWTILLFVFGCAVVVFLVVAILLFIREDWLPGALSTLGTIVTGASVGWIVTRRSEAVQEEEKAYQQVVDVCDDKAAADRVRQSHRLLGGIW